MKLADCMHENRVTPADLKGLLSVLVLGRGRLPTRSVWLCWC